MERLTFEGLFCDIAQCSDTPDGSFCEYGMCSQRATWERLKAYEDTGLTPEQVGELAKADVAPVRHGRWMTASDEDGVVCSICGEDFCTMVHDTERFKFCPNCGARCDGGADDE